MTERGEASLYAQSVSQFLEDSTLRAHQRGVFHDLHDFFKRDLRRGFIDLPTGTGKTVLFVILAKALLAQQELGRKPRILVVTPTKDLVHQTLGRDGKRGFGKFAPEIPVSSFFSDTPREQRGDYLHSQVVVTTYRSFNILSQMGGASRRTLENPGMGRQVSSVLNDFGVFILDEAHHARGGVNSDLVRALPENKIVIGLSATPDEEKLTEVLPHLIHKLELNEAIALGLLSPVVPLGIDSGVALKNRDLFNEDGEFLDNKITNLAEHRGRNRLITDAAAIAAKRGLGIIISCIAGGEAWHARHIAQLLKDQGMSAEAVYDRIPAVRRAQIYKLFEQGEIDALTYVGVLAEGWDSERAKVLINGRPTRSMIVAKQRFGRITRPGGVAFSVDITDQHDPRNPPITVADFLNDGTIPAGRALGVIEDDQLVQGLVEEFRQNLPVLPVLEPRYLLSIEELAALDPVINGQLTTEGQRDPDFAIPSKIYPTYSRVTDEIIQKMSELWGAPVDSRVGRQGQAARVVYNIAQVARLLERLPSVNPLQYYIDGQKRQWISSRGLVTLFGNRYPEINQELMEEALEGIDVGLDWRPVRHNIAAAGAVYRHFRVLKMYLADPKNLEAINKALKNHSEIHGSIK